MTARVSRLRLAAEIMRAEGVLGLRDRLHDKAAERARRHGFDVTRLELGGGHSLPPLPRVAVLSYLSTPPVPWLGGLQTALRSRLEESSSTVAVSLLYPEADRFRLEVLGGSRPLAREAFAGNGAVTPALRDPRFARALAWAAESVGAKVLHLENLHGVPFASVLELCDRHGIRLVISIHDFSFFCPRPHLHEAPVARFCNYSRDLDRCARCLSEDWPIGAAFQSAYRDGARHLLASADALVFSSTFLQRRVAELCPGLDPERQHVIPPAVHGLEADTRRQNGPLRHVAFVGQVQPHKGAAVFEELVGRRARGGGNLRWSVLGGGDRAILRRLRRQPRVTVRGYYRAGSLPRLLRRAGVDLALILSTVPESYGLALDECRAAGVPVLAFDHGAIAERLTAEGGGLLVPLDEGAAGIGLRLRQLREDGLPPVPSQPALPRLADVAARYRALYATLDGEAARPARLTATP
jgi:glycosyltransferase involved in cell wall biosynthesis